MDKKSFSVNIPGKKRFIFLLQRKFSFISLQRREEVIKQGPEIVICPQTDCIYVWVRKGGEGRVKEREREEKKEITGERRK